MIKEIFKYPNPILRRKSERIKEIGPEIRELALNMLKIMKENRGLGIAGPQVGELKRIIVVQTEGGPKVFINPEIVKRGEEAEIGEEGCLSLPGLYLKIKRQKKLILKTLNEKGEKIEMEAKGIFARILQHEIDHLDGILFIDRISFWQKLKIKPKLKTLAEAGSLRI